MKLSPIALFTYNRADHTKRTLDALLANELASESEIYIFSDGPKTLGDEKVASLRNYLSTVKGFKKINIIHHAINKGLANSIIDGVKAVLSLHNSIIVMEDDLLTSPHFLTYMNDGLKKYQDNLDVISIHAYNYPVDIKSQSTFFLRGADCWGWATWKRGWDLFNPNGEELLKKIKEKNFQEDFDFYGSYPYVKMLEDQVSGKNNSWAIRWYASAYLENKLTLYPAQSLVCNIGLDGSGTHCQSEKKLESNLSLSPLVLSDISIEENEAAKKVISRYFKRKKSFFHRLIRKVLK